MTIPSPRAHRRARLEIIPLIDVIFFLLATFMMVSLSMIKNRGIPVQLPAAATSASQERDEFVAISITEAGEIFFNKENVDMAELTRRLERLKAASPDPKVFINGDEQARFGKAIAVLDQVRQLGINKVAIETRAPSAPSQP